MIASASRIFGQERVFHNHRNKHAGYVAIYFPEIQITNSRGLNHTITDIYVRMKFNSDGNMNGMLQGARTSRTAIEKHSRYIHSHLPGSTGDGKWGEFCLGAGSEISLAVVNAAMYSKNSNARMYFEYLLHYIPIFLAWESLEGVPYRYLRNIEPPGSEEGYNAIDSFRRNLNRNIDAIDNIKVRYSKQFPFIRPIYNDYLEKFFQRMTEDRENVTESGNYIGKSSYDELSAMVSNDSGTLTLPGGTKITCKVTYDGKKEKKEQSEPQQISERVPKIYREAGEKLLAERFSDWATKKYPNDQDRVKGDTEPVNLTDGIFKNIVSMSTVQ